MHEMKLPLGSKGRTQFHLLPVIDLDDSDLFIAWRCTQSRLSGVDINIEWVKDIFVIHQKHEGAHTHTKDPTKTWGQSLPAVTFIAMAPSALGE